MGDTTGGAWLGAPRDATLRYTYIYRYRWRNLAGGTSTMYQRGRQKPRQRETTAMAAANEQRLAIRGPHKPCVSIIHTIRLPSALPVD